MKIFIVGGAGYIGSHMVKIAHKAGHDVITLDNLSTGHQDAVLYGEFELCDILDTIKLDKLFKKHKPSAVMHFSGYSLVSESMTDPYKYYNNNVSGTLSLLKAMIDNNCMKFIFSSSAAIFGNPEYIPIDEIHPKNPINPYGKSKQMVEEILSDFESAYGLKYVSFRYFNAAGQDPEGELSERHDPETHLLPIIMQTLNAQRDSISIFGNDYNTKDGTCVRDYIHVVDLAKAHVMAVNHILNNTKIKTAYNLGVGKGVSVQQVIDSFEKVNKLKISHELGPRRAGDVEKIYSDNTKINDELGWFPVMSFDSALETAWNWEKLKN